MKITGMSWHRVAVSRRGNWQFVQVHTDEGITGLGEASQGGNDEAVAAVLEGQLGPALVGWNPLDVEPFFQRFKGLGASRAGATALSAVERVWVYANINRSTWDRSPEGFAQQARQAVGRGFRAVKLAAFDDVPRLDSPEAFAIIRLGIERVLAVREAVGPEVQVLLDCHAHFNAAWAIRVARELEPARLFWYEDPVPRSDLDGLARVHATIEQPVATGETLFGRDGFWPLLTRRILDVAMPDVKHCGGIAELRRIAAMAETAHVQVAPHNPSGPVAMAATVHACATMPNFAILEYAFGEADWRETLVEPAEAIVDGYYTVPDAPGLGVRLNEEVVRRHGAAGVRDA
jgi:galactonate dehydratase